MNDKKSSDFKRLITLQSWKAEMAKAELEKKGIPVKDMSRGSGVSWREIRGGAPSPGIFMPAFPIDIYVPENRLKESKEIINKFGWTEDETEIPKTRPWQKIAAIIVLLTFLLWAAYLVLLIIFS